MGILGLAKLIADQAPSSVKENEIKNFFGRKIAVDASMCIYQFLIAVRQEGNMLTNSEGETTSHLLGLFYRTIRMIDNGIKPVYVFDGKPPQMKSSELEKRQERRAEAQKSLEKAEEEGTAEEVNKFSRRLVKVTKQHNDECKELLRLMGVPYVEAPCEAEAQCAALVKAGKVYATATEDMDALTFGSSVLLRHMTFSEARKMPIKEFHLNKVLEEIEMNQEEFIDLCILLGCDYCESIKGIGPKKAFEYIKTHKNIEGIIEKIDKKKYKIPEDWMYKEARELFKNPEVADSESIELKWNEPDEEGLIKFLCGDKGFGEDRVRNGAKKLMKGRQGSTQGRLDGFFAILPKTTPTKRKAEENGTAKRGKASRGKGQYKRGIQMDALIEAVERHKDIYTKKPYKDDAARRQQWEEVAEELNASGVYDYLVTGECARRKWHDLKYRMKKSGSDIVEGHREGGVGIHETLNPLELVGMIDATYIKGFNHVTLDSMPMNEDLQGVTINQMSENTTPSPVLIRIKRKQAPSSLTVSSSLQNDLYADDRTQINYSPVIPQVLLTTPSTSTKERRQTSSVFQTSPQSAMSLETEINIPKVRVFRHRNRVEEKTNSDPMVELQKKTIHLKERKMDLLERSLKLQEQQLSITKAGFCELVQEIKKLTKNIEELGSILRKSDGQTST